MQKAKRALEGLGDWAGGHKNCSAFIVYIAITWTNNLIVLKTYKHKANWKNIVTNIKKENLLLAHYLHF